MKIILASCVLAGLFTGCGEDHHGHDHSAHEAPQQNTPTSSPSNRIPIPAIVRRNLGISFAQAEYRSVTTTVTMPGFFEPLPSAQQHYPLPLSGRVELLVTPLQKVHKGELLLQVDAPEWRELQTQLVDAQTAILSMDADRAQAEALKQAAGTLSLSEGPSVYDTAIQARQAEYNAEQERFQQLIAQAATLTAISTEQLQVHKNSKPLWQRLAGIPITAAANGIVRAVDAASGTWVEAGTEVIHILSPQAMRFRGKALQADLIDSLRDGQTARINAPEGRGPKRHKESLTGTMYLGVTGNPDTRTLDVFITINNETLPHWVRPQVATMAEVAVAGDPDMEELAIPQRAIIQDGLENIFFRRDPKDPNNVIRTVADLGPSDGRWVTIYSGLAEGDEVVLDGVYQLKLATSRTENKTGHFHADGTFHDGEH